jgi:uncharacterized protein (TIGR01777 family)
MAPLKKLKVGVTGASGFVGQRVVRLLNEHGHEVVAFTRSPERGVPGCVESRAFGPGREIKVAGLDAVIHLAGESVLGLWTPEKKRKILESRRDGTRALVDAILAVGENRPQVLVSASAVGFYGDTGDREVDEASPAGTGFLAEVAKVWEQEALRAEGGGVRVTLLRIGMVLGDEGGAMKLLKPVFQLGLGARLGDGRHWVPWVDVADVAAMAVFALENKTVSGALNASAPVPLRNVDFTKALARSYGRFAIFAAPAFALRMTLGEMSDVLLSSHRVLPKRAEQLGFKFERREL